MRPIENVLTVGPEAPLSSALELLGRDDLDELPVLANGHLEGVLSRAMILGYLRTNAEMRG